MFLESDDISPDDLIGPTLPANVPELRVMGISTLTGAATLHGRSHDLGNRTDSRLLLALRDWSDAVLVGAATVRAEDYSGVRCSKETQALRRLRGQSSCPPLAIVSKSLDFDLSARLFTETPGTNLFLSPSDSMNDPRLMDRRQAIEASGGTLVDIGSGSATEIVTTLRSHGLNRIVSEGGPTLFRRMLQTGNADVLHLTVEPLVNFPVDVPFLALDDDGERMTQRFRLENARATEDSLLFLRYRKVR